MEIKFKVIKNKARKYKESDRLPLYVRLVDGRAFDQTAKTSIMVSPMLWHADREEIKARSICSQEEAEERTKINKTVSDMREFLLRSYDNCPGGVGLSHKAYGMQQLLLEQALQIVSDCSCPFGCPSCAGPMGEIGHNGKRTAWELLNALAR